MAIVKLPSGKTAKIPDGMSEQDAGRFIYDKLRDTPGAESDASAIAQRFGFETTGIGQTIGGTAGAAGGAAAGAALGAFGGPLAPLTIPLGAIAGGALLAGAGGAAGEYAEAELRGVEGDPLEAAAEEWKYGLIPGGAAAPLRLASKGLGTSAGLLSRHLPTEGISRSLGKYASKISPKQQVDIQEKVEASFIKKFVGTHEGKVALEQLRRKGVKLDANFIEKLTKGEDKKKFFKEVLDVSPAQIKKMEREIYTDLVNELIKKQAISRTQKGTALQLLLSGASLDELESGPKLPGEGSRGLL